MNTALNIGACVLALVGFALHLIIYGPDQASGTTMETI